MRVKFQEWPMGLKERPVATFGGGKEISLVRGGPLIVHFAMDGTACLSAVLPKTIAWENPLMRLAVREGVGVLRLRRDFTS